MSKMATLAVIPLVVWGAVLVYLFVLDRKLARLEIGGREDDL